MKMLFIPVFLVALLTACGGGGGTKQEIKTTADSGEKKTAPDMSNNPDYKAGLALISNSDCFTCHKIEDKLVGPAYREVANKYATAGDTAVQYLAGKIIKGGNGVWGEVMMTPHPTVSKPDAEAMAKYVLLLKN